MSVDDNRVSNDELTLMISSLDLAATILPEAELENPKLLSEKMAAVDMSWFSRKWRGAVPGKVVFRPSGGDFQGIGVYRSDGITGHVRTSAACSFRATYSSIKTARTWFIR